MTRKQLDSAVAKVMAAGNPYIRKATQFFIDHKPMYLHGGEFMTAEQLNAEYRKTAEHDIQNGYKERKVGWYDKWYRYSRADEGRAYDEGVRMAVESGKAPDEYNIIEINPMYI